MFKLYDMTTHSLMDMSKDEIEIIKTIATYINLNSSFNFLIVYHNYDLDMDELYLRIHSKEEFLKYYYDYKEKSKNLILERRK